VKTEVCQLEHAKGDARRRGIESCRRQVATIQMSYLWLVLCLVRVVKVSRNGKCLKGQSDKSRMGRKRRRRGQRLKRVTGYDKTIKERL